MAETKLDCANKNFLHKALFIVQMPNICRKKQFSKAALSNALFFGALMVNRIN